MTTIETTKRYYLFAYDGSQYRPVTEQEYEDHDGEDVPVLVEDTGHAIKLRLDVYYCSSGFMELTLTQPLDRALRTFAGLLRVDYELETQR